MKLVQCTLLACAFGLAVPHLNAQSTLSNGLVAYYPFNGNFQDASGHGINPSSAVGTLATDRFGNPTNCIALNGTNSGLVADSFFLNTTYFPGYTTVPLTETIWFCPSNNLTTTNQYLLVTDAGHGGFQYGSALYNTGLGLNAYYYENGAGGFDTYATTTNFTSNVWYQVVGVFTETSIQIYLNGQLQSSISLDNIPSVYGDLDVGSQQTSSGGYRFGFQGRLDDVRIYNRALSSTEVSELYTLEAPPLPTVSLISAFVPAFANLEINSSYQLQVSTNLNGTFTNYGASFVATSSSMLYPGFFVTTNSPELFFRLQGP